MRRLFPLTLLLAVLGSPSLWAYSRIRTRTGDPLRLVSPNVQLVLSEGIGSASNILAGGDPVAALDAARREWNQLSTSTVFFQPFTTSADTLARSDGVNLVTFSDGGQFARDRDTLATTVVIFNARTGTVVDTDVMFNPNIKFFVTPGVEGFDLQSVASHEFGHAITADHTGVLSATMFQSSGELEFFERTLDFDDIAFAASAYPVTDGDRPFGSMAGHVLSDGVPVFGAHVVAYDAGRGIFVSAISSSDGGYTIESIPPGTYSIYAEPFDGPVTPASLFSGSTSAFFGSANTSFIIGSGARQVVVAGQQTENADIEIPAGTSVLNVIRAGRNFGPPSNTAGNFLLAAGPVLASPGQSFNLAVVGDGISSESVQSGDFQLDVEGAGVAISDRRSGSFRSGIVFLSASITVADNAVPGARQVKVTVGGQTSYFTAGLVIAERNVTQSTQRFASVQQSPARFTGIGVTNLADTPAVVRALFYNPAGELFAIPGMRNPVSFSVPPRGQFAGLSQELFQAVRQESGWVELQADQAQVYSFFLAGDSTGIRLNGSDVPRAGLTQGIFTDVRQNATFGTEIYVANGNGNPTAVTFRFMAPAAGVRLGPVSRLLGPRASLSETALELFGSPLPDGGYITFTSDLPVQALELVRSGVALVSLNAQDISGSATLVSPHFAVGNSGGLVFFSRLYLVNPGTAPASVQIEVRDAAGATLRPPVVTLIGAEGSLQVGIGETFGLMPGPAAIGSVVVRSLAGAPIVGSILFGEATSGIFASEFPLDAAAALGRDLVFEQLATAAGFYTGLALFNPSPTAQARVTIEVRTPAGLQLGGTFLQTLGPNEKLTRLITELIAPSINQSGGYIRVRSDQPVSAVVLFGNNAGTVLAAVPASKVQ